MLVGLGVVWNLELGWEVLDQCHLVKRVGWDRNKVDKKHTKTRSKPIGDIGQLIKEDFFEVFFELQHASGIFVNWESSLAKCLRLP